MLKSTLQIPELQLFRFYWNLIVFSAVMDRRLESRTQKSHGVIGETQQQRQNNSDREGVPWSYTCSFCSQEYRSKMDLVQHYCREHQVPHYKCDYCGQIFRKRQNMETHRRIHTGEKPYKCRLCQGSFTAMSGLKYHMNKNHT